MRKYLLWGSIIVFYLLVSRLINRDLYYDEIYSLVHYVFAPLKQTTGVYKDLNNHVFFSLLCNLYMRVFPADLGWLMDRPWVIRMPLLAFSGVTIYYLHRIGKECFNERVGLYAVVLLVTTLPYYYYAVSVRGYNMSVMFMIMITYYLWRKK